MSIYFTAKVVEFSKYDSGLFEEEHASFNLGNSSSLRCLLSSEMDCCGTLTISASKCAQWVRNSFSGLQARVDCDMPIIWGMLSSLATELAKGDTLSDTGYSRIGVVVTWG